MTRAVGAFGKMPSLGDFFQITSPSGFVRVWDAWLQDTMLNAAATGGGAWDEQYMSAPIWRFTLAAGLAGSAPVAGVLMPSVDRVGRRFPLTLMVPLRGGADAPFAHLALTRDFERLETCALDCLSDQMTREGLIGALAALPVPDITAAPGVHRAGEALIVGNALEGSTAAALAAPQLEAFAETGSLWTALVDDVEHTLICNGLPEGSSACALFDLAAPLWSNSRTAA